MKKSVLMQPLLTYKRGATRVIYETNPYKIAAGPLRSMQKYAVIALTAKGSDSLRTWFGTNLSDLPLMNMYDTKAIELFIRDEVREATRQFFLLQNQESNLAKEDIIESIELHSISINGVNNVQIEIMFYPLVGSSVTLSLEV